MRGFSLIELIIVMAILSLLGNLTILFGFSFFQSLALSAETTSIITQLERARLRSLASYNNSDQVVLIENFPPITFHIVTGTTDGTSTLTISKDARKKIITVSPDGTITY